MTAGFSETHSQLLTEKAAVVRPGQLVDNRLCTQLIETPLDLQQEFCSSGDLVKIDRQRQAVTDCLVEKRWQLCLGFRLSKQQDGNVL